MFHKLDTGKNWTLSKQELLEGYKKTMSEIEAEKVIDEIFKKLDIDGSG